MLDSCRFNILGSNCVDYEEKSLCGGTDFDRLTADGLPELGTLEFSALRIH